MDKVNGLHSGTIICERSIWNGRMEEIHLHPDTKELIVMETWMVQNGEDDVDHDFEVTQVIQYNEYLVKILKTIQELKEKFETI